MDVNSVIAVVTANSIVLAILAFLTKSIITHWLNKDVEAFKSQLAQDAAKSISSYQSALEKERIRLQISYGGIFEKQANVIVELFRLVTELEKTINDATFNSSDQCDYYDEFIDAWRALVHYYDENRVLLPESVDVVMTNFHRNVAKGVQTYRSAEKYISRANISNEQIDKMFSRQDRALADLEQIPILKKELTEKLRSIIGVAG
ncbi:hypothetical protein ALT761_02637 [Alteromonas sp. 76-1]|jgi:hypothetical protein|uniref:hypothetical protein n=1 Tax=Alteromonas sp. 76-1 TaxID=2358187 RepID=UPI000FD17125|nr:hypothetical protein [Alteromonas sp. 76-1]VEL97632.1 hypothetical protein ALT761_02637 [Alteromonas sp. 76-1]